MSKKKNPRISWTSGDITGSQVVFGDGNNVLQGQGNRIQQIKSAAIGRAELKELLGLRTSGLKLRRMRLPTKEMRPCKKPGSCSKP